MVDRLTNPITRLPDHPITRCRSRGSALRRPRQRRAARRGSGRAASVQPIYVSVGLAWEARGARGGRAVPRERARVDRPRAAAGLADRRHARRLPGDALGHRRDGRPATTRRTRTCICPGRNIMLLGKAAVYCAAAGIGRLVLGTLDHNPFPDATPAVPRGHGRRAVARSRHTSSTIDAPYARISKADVIRRGVALGVPLELTLSCMNPARRPAGTAWSTAASAASAASATRRLSRRESRIRRPTQTGNS